MRLFVALSPPGWIRERIGEGTRELRALEGVRWVAPEKVHLTLKFIGETGEGAAGDIVRALEDEAAGHRPFELRLSGPGAFPTLRRPRVVWLGIDSSDALLALQRGVEEALYELEIAREDRAFHPHLTLGRARRGFRVDVERLESLAGCTVVTGSWRVDSIELMRSHLRASGAEYEALASAGLVERDDRGRQAT